MTQDEKDRYITEVANRLSRAVPENIVLTGAGEFKGAIGNDRNRTFKKEEILYAIHTARMEAEMLASLVMAVATK